MTITTFFMVFSPVIVAIIGWIISSATRSNNARKELWGEMRKIGDRLTRLEQKFEDKVNGGK